MGLKSHGVCAGSVLHVIDALHEVRQRTQGDIRRLLCVISVSISISMKPEAHAYRP